MSTNENPNKPFPVVFTAKAAPHIREAIRRATEDFKSSILPIAGGKPVGVRVVHVGGRNMVDFVYQNEMEGLVEDIQHGDVRVFSEATYLQDAKLGHVIEIDWVDDEERGVSGLEVLCSCERRKHTGKNSEEISA